MLIIHIAEAWILIVKEFNDNEKNESDFLNIKVRIYSKLALCEFKQGNVENVIKYLEITKFSNLEAE